MISSDKLLIERDSAVVTLTLNMPDTRNALTDADLCAQLVDTLQDCNADLGIRCAILTGAGEAFSSGGNLKHMRDGIGMFSGDAAGVREGYRNGIQRVAKALWGCEIPLIAAVNGKRLKTRNPSQIEFWLISRILAPALIRFRNYSQLLNKFRAR